MSAEFKLSLVMVTSLNGKITKGDDSDVTKWTSREDKAHFSEVRKTAKVIIVGRKTFEITSPKPNPDKLRIVLTGDPEKYKDRQVPGQLEFTNENPAEIIRRLKEKGYSEALLLGGADAIASFLNEGLIDELDLTIEPVLFPEGLPIFSKIEKDISLELISMERLNEIGTLLIKYKVLNANKNT